MEATPSLTTAMRSSMNLVQHVCNMRMARILDTPKSSNTCGHEAIKNCAQCMRKQLGGGEVALDTLSGCKSHGTRG